MTDSHSPATLEAHKLTCVRGDRALFSDLSFELGPAQVLLSHKTKHTQHHMTITRVQRFKQIFTKSRCFRRANLYSVANTLNGTTQSFFGKSLTGIHRVARFRTSIAGLADPSPQKSRHAWIHGSPPADILAKPALQRRMKCSGFVYAAAG